MFWCALFEESQGPECSPRISSNRLLLSKIASAGLFIVKGVPLPSLPPPPPPLDPPLVWSQAALLSGRVSRDWRSTRAALPLPRVPQGHDSSLRRRRAAAGRVLRGENERSARENGEGGGEGGGDV